MAGRQIVGEPKPTRSLWDWFLVVTATGIFLIFATMARVPQMSLHWGPAVALSAAMLVLLVVCGFALWRTTRFNWFNFSDANVTETGVESSYRFFTVLRWVLENAA